LAGEFAAGADVITVENGRETRDATQAVDVMTESSRLTLCCVPAESSEEDEEAETDAGAG